MRERNSLDVFRLALIDLLIVADTKDTLVDLEKELGLCSVVDGNARPLGLTF